jgi:hypothetical protein
MPTNYLVPDQEKLEWQKPIENRFLTAPPSTSKGKRYIVASVATGDWVGQENNIAVYNGSTWDFIVKKIGMLLYVKDESIYVRWNNYLEKWEENIDSSLKSQDVIDYSKDTFNFDYNVDIDNYPNEEITTSTGEKIAQNFRLTGGTEITKLSLYCSVTDRDSGIKIEITNVDVNNKPSTTIYSTIIVPDDWDVWDYEHHILNIKFKEPIALNNSGVYAIVITDLSDSHSFVKANKPTENCKLWKWDGISDWVEQTNSIVFALWENGQAWGQAPPILDIINNSLISRDLIFPKSLKINNYPIRAYENAVKISDNFDINNNRKSLDVTIFSGKFEKWLNGEQTIIDISRTNFTLTAETTNYIYINSSDVLASGIILPSSSILLYEIITDASGVTTVTDKRTVLSRNNISRHLPFFLG